MAKRSMINREIKRMRAVEKYAVKRARLRETLRSANATEEERRDAQQKLHSLPRNASPVRLQRRCRLTGRPHAVYRKFGLGRNKLREAAMRGDIPGLRKASW